MNFDRIPGLTASFSSRLKGKFGSRFSTFYLILEDQKIRDSLKEHLASNLFSSFDIDNLVLSRGGYDQDPHAFHDIGWLMVQHALTSGIKIIIGRDNEWISLYAKRSGMIIVSCIGDDVKTEPNSIVMTSRLDSDLVSIESNAWLKEPPSFDLIGDRRFSYWGRIYMLIQNRYPSQIVTFRGSKYDTSQLALFGKKFFHEDVILYKDFDQLTLTSSNYSLKYRGESNPDFKRLLNEIRYIQTKRPEMLIYVGCDSNENLLDLTRHYTWVIFHLYNDKIKVLDYPPNVIIHSQLFDDIEAEKWCHVETHFWSNLSDLDSQSRWISILDPVGFMLRFDIENLIGDEYEYLIGDLWIQAFTKPNSMELRLVGSETWLNIYSLQDIREKMNYFNSYFRPMNDTRMRLYIESLQEEKMFFSSLERPKSNHHSQSSIVEEYPVRVDKWEEWKFEGTLIYAASASGKTKFIRDYEGDLCILDSDDIINKDHKYLWRPEYIHTPEFYRITNSLLLDVLKDPNIIVIGNGLNMIPTMIVQINETVHRDRGLIRHKKYPNHPFWEWEDLMDNRIWLYSMAKRYNIPIFRYFDEAILSVIRPGRIGYHPTLIDENLRLNSFKAPALVNQTFPIVDLRKGDLIENRCFIIANDQKHFKTMMSRRCVGYIYESNVLAFTAPEGILYIAPFEGDVNRCYVYGFGSKLCAFDGREESEYYRSLRLNDIFNYLSYICSFGKQSKYKSLSVGFHDDSDIVIKPCPFNDFGVGRSIYSMIDFCMVMAYHLDGKRVADFIGMNPKHKNNILYYADIKEGIIEYEDYQTWLNSQTSYVKFIGTQMRFVFGFSTTFARQFRNAVLSRMISTFVPINSHDVNGHAILEGRKVYLSVSGHVINLLIASSFTTIDINRYMKTVESNILTSRSVVQYMKKFNYLTGRNLLSERGWKYYTKLWHNYYDYYYAIIVYISLCRVLKIELNVRGIKIILKFLRKRTFMETKNWVSYQVELFLSN